MEREEAIKKLQKQKAEYLKEWVDFSGVAEAYDMAIEALSEQKTGVWVKSDILPNGWHCSHCDAPVMTDDISEMLFCPNCGSYNGGEEE